jgi:hypothetical protein
MSEKYRPTKKERLEKFEEGLLWCAWHCQWEEKGRFGKDSSNKSTGLKNWCRQAFAESRRALLRNNPKYINLERHRVRSYRQTLSGHAKTAMKRVVAMARQFGQTTPVRGSEQHKILFSKVVELASVTPVCPYLGIRLRYSASGNGSGNPSNNTASLDHKLPISTHPHLILDPDNWEWVSWKFNNWKRHHSHEELAILCKTYLSNIGRAA